MVNRKEVLFGLLNNDDKTFMSLMCDKADRAIKTKTATYTKFVAPREQNLISERMSRFVQIKCFGGFDDSERNIVCFADYDDFYGEIEFPIDVLKINATNKKVYSHRDYLGSILALGIKRELIGDIVINDECAYVFCHNEISDYIIYNLEKIANARVVIDKCDDISEADIPQKQFKQRNDTVTSLRLDCVVSAAANMSRATSSDAVKKGLVSLNYDTNCHVATTVSDGDVISVRGYGKFIINTDGTLTKKGRYHIQILQYI